MADNFDDFLGQVEPFDDVQDDDENDVTGYVFVKEDEIKSVNRFKSPVNALPLLSSLCILKISSWMNELTCPSSHGAVLKVFDNIPSARVQKFYQTQVKQLPENMQAKIVSQLSFTTLKCLHQDKIWDLDPVVIASGIKQEEDMLRYLYWKNPTDPLLKEFEKTLTLDVFGDKSILNLLNKNHLPPTAQIKDALVQPYREDCFNFKFREKYQFMKNFQEITNGGCLQRLNWNNVLVVGGSVLKSLRQETHPNPNPHYIHGQYTTSDIDIYIYGLSKEQAQAKVEEIYKAILAEWKKPIGIFKTASTITFVSDYPFRNVQIILSTYASPLEILLASDMNSCSIGFNGSTVLTIPRFLFGAIYGSNVLDSSTKFGTKLRWERLAKYFHRGYNIVSPLHVRIHGQASFTHDEPIDKHIHPSTRQMIELMCLNKMILLRIVLGYKHFGTDRESEFDKWPLRWTRGVHIMHRSFLSGWETNEYQQLCGLLQAQPPQWVKNYYKSAQNLTLPAASIREAPRYSENWRTIDQLSWAHNRINQRNFHPEDSRTIHEYVEEHCKFDDYNESSLQCFHLNFFVEKEQTESNPYKDMNTSLATLHYKLLTVPLVIKDFNKYLNGDISNISSVFVLNGRHWKLSFDRASNAISFLSLTKEEDDQKDALQYQVDQANNLSKLFVNFLIRIKNSKTVKPRETWRKVPGDITYDGSQVFTNTQPSNMWLTWIRNDYIRSQMNDASEHWIQHLMQEEQTDARPKYVNNDGFINVEITMQFIEPQINATSL